MRGVCFRILPPLNLLQDQCLKNFILYVVKASLSSLEGKRSVVSRQRLQTSKTLPPRMLKGASQLSLTSKQKIRARPQEYSYSPVASFQEITRLISLNDEQKQFITQLQNEIKTLKIVC